MTATSTHKGRESWRQWHGTPSRIARIAREARTQVESAGSGGQTIKLEAPTWESVFDSVDAFEEDLRASDLPDVRVVEIVAGSSDTEARIAVNLHVPKPVPSVGSASAQLGPAAELFVAGTDRDWVDSATRSMIDAVGAGQPGNRRTSLFLGAGLALGMIGVLIATSFDRPIHTIGSIVAILGAATLVIALAVQVVTPSFELIPDGDLPRRKKFARRIRAEGTWLIRQAFGGMVGFLLGIGATLLYKHWFA